MTDINSDGNNAPENVHLKETLSDTSEIDATTNNTKMCILPPNILKHIGIRRKVADGTVSKRHSLLVKETISTNNTAPTNIEHNKSTEESTQENTMPSTSKVHKNITSDSYLKSNTSGVFKSSPRSCKGGFNRKKQCIGIKSSENERLDTEMNETKLISSNSDTLSHEHTNSVNRSNKLHCEKNISNIDMEEETINEGTVVTTPNSTTSTLLHKMESFIRTNANSNVQLTGKHNTVKAKVVRFSINSKNESKFITNVDERQCKKHLQDGMLINANIQDTTTLEGSLTSKQNTIEMKELSNSTINDAQQGNYSQVDTLILEDGAKDVKPKLLNSLLLIRQNTCKEKSTKMDQHSSLTGMNNEKVLNSSGKDISPSTLATVSSTHVLNNNSSDIMPLVSRPRKRGRPRKSNSILPQDANSIIDNHESKTNLNETNVEVAETRNSGSVLDVHDTIHGESVLYTKTLSDKSKNSMNHSTTDHDVPEQNTMNRTSLIVSPVPQPRKRGRPRKNNSAHSANSNLDANLPRSSMNSSETDIQTSQKTDGPLMIVNTSKRRSNNRTLCDSIIIDDNDVDNEDENTVEHVPTEENASRQNTETQESKSKNSIKTPTVLQKRKRGRPRKSDVTPSPILERNSTVNDESLCMNLLEDNRDSRQESNVHSASLVQQNDLTGERQDTMKNTENEEGPVFPEKSTKQTARGRKSRKRKADTSMDSECNQTSETIVDDQDPIKLMKTAELVKCAKCNKEIERRQWASHNLLRHNNMSWREGDEPMDFDNDEKLLKSILMVAIKKRNGSLRCEKCGTTKRSAIGFISHLRFCGKTDEERHALKVTCSICNAVIMPASMEVHLRYHKLSESNKNAAAETCDIGGERTKRKAAERAVSKILEFTKDGEEKDQYPVPEKKIATSVFKSLIQPPELKKRIPGIVKNLWKKDLNSAGTAKCRQPGCGFSASCLEVMCKHYSECNFTPQENFVCRICKFTAASKGEMEKHVIESHALEDNETKVSDFEDEGNDNLSDDSEHEVRDNKHNLPAVLSKAFSNKLKAAYNRIHCYPLPSRFKWRKAFPPAAIWGLEFELKNYRLQLYNTYLPNTFVPLKVEDAVKYLPELKTSMPTKKVNAHAVKDDQSTVEWKHWNRFEGSIDKDVPTFFVGGPIWALAWLPIPLPMHNRNVAQYLAVSTHPTMTSDYTVGKAYSGSNVIQIWNVGALSHTTQVDEYMAPVLSYAIVHHGGTVWSLEWCPSGCYQDEHVNNCSEEKSSKKRMGMLAAACSDGCVYIYSMPFPDELGYKSTNEYPWPVYKVDPKLTLVVNIAMYDAGKQNWQCTKLSWSKENGHNIIAAGYSNGYIALWDLETESPLLVQQQGNTILLNAFKHFLAHSNAVTMVSLIPCDGNRYLCSASVDRFYKFWDLEDVSCPKHYGRNSIMLNGDWLMHWNCAIVSSDDALKLGHTNTCVYPFRQYFRFFRVLPTTGPTYAVSVSNHANSVAHGTISGDVLSLFLHDLSYSKDTAKVVRKKRCLNSFIKVVDLSEERDNSVGTSKSNKKEDQKKSEEYHYMPDTYEECSRRYGIVFYDNINSLPDDAISARKNLSIGNQKLSSVQIEQYPFTSVNRLSSNPNAWSHPWYAVGYQNGLVRLLNFRSVCSADKAEILVSQYAKNMLNKMQVSDKEDSVE